ncbi:hypothetical protein ACO2Q8_20470 [Larkinella sp. VNQ87]|uniref:hypothetical protein n=1 Tax=Larkinella sp. VNQ87 TaxID=3400921 RepID=UPI003C0AC084
MVKISLDELKLTLQRVLQGEVTREEAANWAFKLREMGDNNSLEYAPEDSEQKIWDAILVVEGIDLKDSPNSYLHNNDDIQRFLLNL